MENAVFEHLDVWIQQSRDGDREAFGRIVRHYQGIVSGVVYGMLGDFHKSEDIAQETFLVAWKKLDELRDVTKFPAWLCGIARNLTKKHLERTPKLASLTDADATEVPTAADDPATRLAREERNRLLWDALENIPEQYRVPLVLYYRSEKSVPEIAAALDCSEDALAMRLSRARKFLRKELERRVADAIASSGPGEFFSLAVIAALPVAVLSTSTGQAAAATVLGTATTTAAVPIIIVTQKPVGGTASLFGSMSFGSWFCNVASFLLTVLGFFFWILGATPGIWLSVRNAPTLRARRYLILTSLRLHVVFAGFMAFACLLPACWILFHAFPNNKYYLLADMVLGAGYPGGLGLIGAAALFLLIRSPLIYRRIVEEDSGLRVSKNVVTLEESFLSFQRLERSFFRSAVSIFAFFLSAATGFILWREMVRIKNAPHTRYSFGTEWGNYWTFYFQHYVFFVVVGLVFLFVFWRLHRSFLATAKDDAAFAATPPRKFGESVKQPELSFCEKIFAEWLVSFGLFVAAVLIFSQTVVPLGITYLPVTHFVHLVLLVGGSAILAVLNIRFPAFRWFIGFGVFAVLVFCSVYGLMATLNRWWGDYPFQDFFESPRAWPMIFGLILVDRIILFGTVTALVGGVFWLRNRWTDRPSRLLSRKSFAAVLIVATVAILGLSLLKYSETKYQYHSQLMDFVDDWRSKNDEPEKVIVLASEVLRLAKDKPEFGSNALQTRAMQYLKLGRFAEAVADYNELVGIYDTPVRRDSNQVNRKIPLNYRAFRGEANLALGECRKAIADFNKVLERPLRLWGGKTSADVYYNRGYAYEKLGDTAKAIADYDEVIQILEQKPFKEQRKVCSVAVRPGYDDEKHRSTLAYQPGFRISLEELKEIRDALEKH